MTDAVYDSEEMMPILQCGQVWKMELYLKYECICQHASGDRASYHCVINYIRNHCILETQARMFGELLYPVSLTESDTWVFVKLLLLCELHRVVRLKMCFGVFKNIHFTVFDKTNYSVYCSKYKVDIVTCVTFCL